jgi:hypothetical protein
MQPQLALSSRQCPRPQVPENHRVWLTTWLSFPVLPLSRLSPCDFALFPKLKMKLNDVFKRCLTSKGNHKRYMTALRKMTSMVLLKHEKTMGSLYTFPRRLFWRRWRPKLSKLSQHFFSDLVRELSDSTPESLRKVCCHTDNEDFKFYYMSRVCVCGGGGGRDL